MFSIVNVLFVRSNFNETSVFRNETDIFPSRVSAFAQKLILPAEKPCDSPSDTKRVLFWIFVLSTDTSRKNSPSLLFDDVEAVMMLLTPLSSSHPVLKREKLRSSADFPTL